MSFSHIVQILPPLLYSLSSPPLLPSTSLVGPSPPPSLPYSVLCFISPSFSKLPLWVFLTHFLQYIYCTYCWIKVFTKEKRGGLSAVSFDGSPFKLFSLKLSNKLVQAPSCERPKTAPRTLFLSFANYNCFPIRRYSVGLRHPFHIIHLIETTVLYVLPDIWKDGKNRLSIINIFK